MRLLFIFLSLVPLISASTPPLRNGQCRKGSGRECKRALFVPGFNLLGEGINIVTMKSTHAFIFDMNQYLTNNTCTLCRDPHHHNREWKLPRALSDWKILTTCQRKVVTKESQSEVSMAKETTSDLQNNWMAGLDLIYKAMKGSFSLAGSHAKTTVFASNQLYKDKYTFFSNKVECTYYSFRLNDKYQLSPIFVSDLAKLPKWFNSKSKSKYWNFISTYGTHYVTKATIGGRAWEVTAVKTCQVSLNSMTMEQVKICLDVEAAISVIGIENLPSLRRKAAACKALSKRHNNGRNFHAMHSERIWEVTGGNATFDLLDSNAGGSSSRFTYWMNSAKKIPALLTYMVKPVYTLIKGSNHKRLSLKEALSQFIKEKALKVKCACPGNAHFKHDGQCACACDPSMYKTSDCCPKSKSLARLQVKITSGHGLYGDFLGQTDGYVKFRFGREVKSTGIIWNNNNPRWDQWFDFGIVELSRSRKYTIEGWDQDTFKDEFLGKCEDVLKASSTSKRCHLKHGSIRYFLKVTCAASLSGDFCEVYQPTPSRKSTFPLLPSNTTIDG
ncbi:perforin-1 [Xenopus laevis]|uniref:Perforin-1 n=1 Tax=Xenopus laevis TaxID=8355 RepID=A0A8J0TVK5_XENLA|nr:perforin-1 [Xenopus laevis]OCT59073.1 hypothetical protein XELAEV_18001561mg [Xenopus laevis]